jgi:uncharacterized protein
MEVMAPEWERYMTSEAVDPFTGPVLALALNDDEERGEMRMTPERRAKAIEMMPVAILGLYLFMRERDGISQPRANHPIKSTKVGRNEPCPCGSGKKYKRCCGSGDRWTIN